MDQGQQAPPAPRAQPAIAVAPPVLPTPPPPPPVVPAPPTPPVFALGPGRSHPVLDYDDPNTGATATKLYNNAISPLRKSSMGRQITWPCSWPVCATGLDSLIGIASSQCQLAMGRRETYSPTTGKCPWRTPGCMQLRISTRLRVMPKTMTCCTISWPTRWPTSSEQRSCSMQTYIQSPTYLSRHRSSSKSSSSPWWTTRPPPCTYGKC